MKTAQDVFYKDLEATLNETQKIRITVGLVRVFRVLHRFSTGFHCGNVENCVEMVENPGERYKIVR